MAKEPQKTAAKIGAPPRATRMSLVESLEIPAAIGEVANNMKTDNEKEMGFKVSREFHLEFKTTASLAGLSMKELLEQSFNAWKDKNGRR